MSLLRQTCIVLLLLQLALLALLQQESSWCKCRVQAAAVANNDSVPQAAEPQIVISAVPSWSDVFSVDSHPEIDTANSVASAAETEETGSPLVDPQNAAVITAIVTHTDSSVHDVTHVRLQIVTYVVGFACIVLYGYRS